MQGGESRLETWPNKETGGEHKRFLGEILRGDPRKLSSLEDAERLAKLRRAALRRLPRGQQPSIAEAFEHAGTHFETVSRSYWNGNAAVLLSVIAPKVACIG